MSSYRLTYRNGQAFCVDIEPAQAQGVVGSICQGLVYRVTRGTKESTPLLKADGSPLVIHGVTEAMVLTIGASVLETVSSSGLEGVTKEGGPYAMPALRLA